MADILPEPAETTTTISPAETQPTRKGPRTKRTMWVLVCIVIIGILCLVAAYIYDFVNNRDQDNTRKQDISYISGVLNDYYNLYHYYPTLNQLNSSTFGAFAPTLDRSKFKDPSYNDEVLSASPSSSSYAYEVTPAGCNNTTVDCSGYKLVATLYNGNQYVITNPSSPSRSSKH